VRTRTTLQSYELTRIHLFSLLLFSVISHLARCTHAVPMAKNEEFCHWRSHVIADVMMAHPVFDDLRDRSAPICQHRCTARQRLDQHHPETAPPVIGAEHAAAFPRKIIFVCVDVDCRVAARQEMAALANGLRLPSLKHQDGRPPFINSNSVGGRSLLRGRRQVVDV
jgi:hypothetical protein